MSYFLLLLTTVDFPYGGASKCSFKILYMNVFEFVFEINFINFAEIARVLSFWNYETWIIVWNNENPISKFILFYSFYLYKFMYSLKSFYPLKSIFYPNYHFNLIFLYLFLRANKYWNSLFCLISSNSDYSPQGRFYPSS